MHKIRAVVRLIDAFNEQLGRIVAWFALIMVLMQFIVVVLRYVFGLGFIPMQESIVFMHAMLFLVAAGYTLLHDGHVRVDIFYGGATEKSKALVNFLGVLVFLWPLCAMLMWKSLVFVGASRVYGRPFHHRSTRKRSTRAGSRDSDRLRYEAARHLSGWDAPSVRR